METIESTLRSHSPEELFAFIKGIKSRDMRTNSTWTMQSLKASFDEGRVWICLGIDAALVLAEDGFEIIRLTYYAESADCLVNLANLIPEVKGKIVCDLIGRDSDVERWSVELPDHLFKSYATYRRMICDDIVTDNDLDLAGVSIAGLSDAEILGGMLSDEFDPMTAHMLSPETLRARIANHDVVVMRTSNDISGLAVFDAANKKVGLLDYIIVNRDYRRQGVGRKLINYKWRYANNCKYYYLWVNAEKQGAIDFHESNGFRFDGVSDRIFAVSKTHN